MADADALRALIERVEAAGGPDRVLGIDLLSTLWPDKYRRAVTNGGEDDGHVYLQKRLYDDDKMIGKGWYGVADENPTASLDAVVALVGRTLPDPYWRVGGYTHGFWAEVDAASAPTACGSGPTPALALCAALLRALPARTDRPNP